MATNAATSVMDAPVAESYRRADAERSAEGDATRAATDKVAYVLSRFPKLTETFVLYEILAIEQQGVPVEIFPLLSMENAATNQGASLGQKIAELFKKPVKRPVMHPDAAPLVEKAHYHPLFSLRVLAALVRVLFRQPFTVLGTLGTLIRANWGSWNFLLGGLAIFPKCAWIAREMQRAGVTHMHAHFANHPATAAFIIHRLTGIPFSFTAHGSDLHMDRHMLREKVREAARVITISWYNRDLILDECGSEFADKVEIIRCGVDTRVFQGNANPVRDASRPLEILCIGTMHEVKGQTHLLDACRLLSERGVKFVCHLVGKGPDWDKLNAQVREAGLNDRVIFHGLLTREQVAELVRRCDVLAAPSVLTEDGRREGIPVVLMEAMASELPVVASRLSGIPELVDDGTNGYLVPPRDAQALAGALERLSADPEMRRHFGIAGREKVLREFDVHRNGELLSFSFFRKS